MKEKRFSADILISISAVIIAVISIAIGVWQGIETRRHYRLSVQPRLDLYYSQDYVNKTVQYLIRNNGLGPAPNM